MNTIKKYMNKKNFFELLNKCQQIKFDDNDVIYYVWNKLVEYQKWMQY